MQIISKQTVLPDVGNKSILLDSRYPYCKDKITCVLGGRLRRSLWREQILPGRTQQRTPDGTERTCEVRTFAITQIFIIILFIINIIFKYYK